MRVSPSCLAAFAGVAALISPAFAQTTYVAVQPNETKQQATLAFEMLAGDRLAAGGGCTSAGDAEIFRVRTAPLPPGLYRHRLVPVAPILSLHYPSLLGRTQLDSVIDPTSTVVLQQSSDQTVPARFVQWYGFGAAEEVFVDLDDASSCRSSFLMELETAPVQPTVVPVSSTSSGVLVQPTTGSSSMDLDLWLFDADFDAVPESASRAAFGAGAFLDVQASPGRYYVGVTQGPFHLHRKATTSDVFDSDHVLDFRGAAASGTRDVGATVELDFLGTVVQATFTEPYEVLWFQFDLDVGQNTTSFCPGDGSDGACPCGASPPGQGAGCANSTGRGARLFAYWDLEPRTVLYEVEDVPPFASTVLFAGLGAGAGTPAFAGNRCVRGPVVRLGPIQADAAGRVGLQSGSPFFNAGFLAGTTVYAQAAYRDAAAGGPCNANFTNGSRVLIR